MVKRHTRKRSDLFDLGTVCTVPLCDAHNTELVRGVGLALLVARSEPFTVKDGRALVFGFPGVADLNRIEESWFYQAPSIAMIVYTRSVVDADWTKVGLIDSSRIQCPKFKTYDDHNRWRHSTFDPVAVTTAGREWIITDAEAQDRAYGFGDAILFQCRLYFATRLGWKWAPPMEVLINGFRAVEHLL